MPGVAVDFTRDHAERGLELLERNNVRLTVWVNHGGLNNRQNIGSSEWMQGDRPGMPEYHADLLHNYGTEFFWTLGQTDRLGGRSVISEQRLNDGTSAFSFRRFQSLRNAPDAPRLGRKYDLNCFYTDTGDTLLQVWLPRGLAYQMSENVLDLLVREQYMCIVGQHLGAMPPLTGFDRDMVAALRRLRRFQDAGLILVARTSRLLHYNRVRDHLVFQTIVGDQQRSAIDIEAVCDPVRGRWLPCIEDLRGITFETPAEQPVQLYLRGVAIDPAEIAVAPREGGKTAVGIRWFAPELTDHAAAFLATGRTTFVLWNEAARAAAKAENTAVLALLDEQRELKPPNVDAGKYAAAVNYARGRYEVGLPHYVQAMERIGFTDMRLGLDVGSGAGHRSLAFLKHGEKAVGIEANPEFVEIAVRIADRLGCRHRVQFLAQRGEDMEVAQNAFDCAWSHSVLMYTNHAEQIVERIARALVTGGSFYCAYTGAGHRLRSVHDRLFGNDPAQAATQITILLSAYLYQCGVYFTPRSRVRMLDLEDVLRICRTFGFAYVGQPEVQDGAGTYLGVTATFDFVTRKNTGPDRHRQILTARKPVETAWLQDLERIGQSGAPGFVCDVLRAADPELTDAAERDLYARSLVRAGRAAEAEARALFEGDPAARRLSDRAMGLYDHDRGRIDQALACYQRLDDTDPDRSFSVGMCQLQMEDWEAARRTFGTAIERNAADTREWIGHVAAYHGAGDYDGARRVFHNLIESRG